MIHVNVQDVEVAEETRESLGGTPKEVEDT